MGLGMDRNDSSSMRQIHAQAYSDRLRYAEPAMFIRFRAGDYLY